MNDVYNYEINEKLKNIQKSKERLVIELIIIKGIKYPALLSLQRWNRKSVWQPFVWLYQALYQFL